jgi:YidC/Oxa1 family membrane protein insertase
MKFDRNTVIGFVLLALLFFGFFYFNNQEQARVLKNRAIKDSIENASKPKIKVDTSVQKGDTSHLSTPQIASVTGQFQKAMIGSEQLATVENDLVKVTFTNKGGQIRSVELKNFKDQQKNLVKLTSSDFDKIDYKIKADSDQVGNITDFYFTPGTVISKGDSVQTITYTIGDSSGRSITHEFVLRKDDYMIDFNVKLNKANTFLDNDVMNLQWQYRARKQEKDLSYERTNSQMGYVMDGDFDYYTIGRRSDVQFAKPVQWVAMRQRFFNGILVAKDNFSGGKMEWNSPNDSATVVQSTATLQHFLRLAPGAHAAHRAQRIPQAASPMGCLIPVRHAHHVATTCLVLN